MKKHSKNVANAIHSYLEKKDEEFLFDQKNGDFHTKYNGEVVKGLFGRIYVKDNCYSVINASPLLRVDQNDKETMRTMGDFLFQVGEMIEYGNFSLDLQSGMIHYQCFVDCDGITPTFEMVENSIEWPRTVFELCTDGMMDILYENKTANQSFNLFITNLSEYVQELKAEGNQEEIGKMKKFLSDAGIFLTM